MPSSSQSNLSKAQRREAARDEARKLREEQARKEARTRRLVIGGVIALVVVVAAALFFIISNGSRSLVEQLADPPANTTADGGISLGSDLVAGTENEGAPVLEVYLDFTCPHCATFEETNGADIDEVVSAGDATVVYHPVAILDRTEGAYTGFSGRAVQAAAVVADEAPEAYNAFQAAMFDLVAAATTAEPTNEQIAAAAAEAGVPQEVADSLARPEADQPFTGWVDAVTQQFGRDGYTGTPTVLIDGEQIESEVWGTPGALADALRGA